MAPPSWLIVRNSDVLIDVHAHPGAKRSAIVGEHGGRLKIAIASPPVDGKANSALIAFLAKTLSVSKSTIEIVNGETSRQKRFLIKQMTESECLNKIFGAL